MPKIQLSPQQLRALASLTKGEGIYRQESALQPIGRAHLVQRWMSARQRCMDAIGAVRDIERAPFKGVVADPYAPTPPVDQAALALAQQALDAAMADEAAAWGRIQRMVDRARALMADQWLR
mgnify:CR=1 FL=1